MYVRAKLPNFETRFFSNLGIVSDCDIKKNTSCTWRLDYLAAEKSNEDEKFIILICQKILSRGEQVILSPKLESNFRELFGNTGVLEVSNQDFNHFVDTNKEMPYKFDSPREKKFFQEILPKKFGTFFKKHVLYQPYVIDDYSSSRVDFLLGTKTIIELDGDEHDERKQREYDADREKKLRLAGFVIIRISNEDVDENNLIKLKHINTLNEKYTELTPEIKIVLAAKLALQVQLVLSEIIYSYGFKDTQTIFFDTSFQPFNYEELNQILSLVLDDFKELIGNIIDLYSLEIFFNNIKIEVLKNESQYIEGSPFITFDENTLISQNPFIIQDIIYEAFNSVQDRVFEEKDIKKFSEDIILFFLKYIFRFETLRGGQLETIQRILEKKDTITLLPTGAGKSICFQLPSFLFIGNTLIICPITSLMDDQVENLKDKFYIDKAIAIHSKQNNKEDLNKIFQSGKSIFTYVSPERFQGQGFRYDIKRLNTTIPISLVAIDEAHCLSEWGHDFRVAYLHIGRLIRELTNNAPLLALTGTASYSVLNDIKRDLEISKREAVITPETFDRKEIDFFIVEDSHNEKEKSLISILKKDIPARLNKSVSSFINNPQNGGIIFCPHTRGSFGKDICDKLKGNGLESSFYSSTMKGIDKNLWENQIRENAKKFKKNQISLLVATKAFGMGIDKPNVRYTVHYGIPASIESYYQEAGRAGRDRNKAVSFIIFSNINDELNTEILDLNTSFEQVREKVRHLSWNKQDDVIRQIGFHVGFYNKREKRFIGGSFCSIEKEKEYLNKILDSLFDYKNQELFTFISYKDGEDKVNKEKSIYRLSILGFVKDYTIDWNKKHFDIILNNKITNKQIIDNYARYLSSYNRSKVKLMIEPLKEYLNFSQVKFLKKICNSIIEFVYDNIEKSKRRSLKEMFLLAKEGLKENNLVRKRILNYLETNFSEEIEELINNEFIFGDANIIHLENMIEGYEEIETGEMKGGIRTSKEALDFRGEVVRYLESQPDHPELLFLRSISEMFCSDCSEEIVIKEFINCVVQAKKYQIETEQIAKAVILFFKEILYVEKENLIKKILQVIKNDDELLKKVLNHDFEIINITKYTFYHILNSKLKKYLGDMHG